MDPAIAAIWLQLTADERIPACLDLSQDLAFSFLPPGAAASYIDAALHLGNEAAAAQTRDPLALARDLGVTVTYSPQDLRVGAAAIRAEYDARRKTITLYAPAVAAVDRCLAEAINASQTASALLLAHELFHHLEATRFPPVDQQLPPVQQRLLGGLWRPQRHIRAAREIAAHAFASRLTNLPFYAGALEWLLAMSEGRLTPAEVTAALNDANQHLNLQP